MWRKKISQTTKMTIVFMLVLLAVNIAIGVAVVARSRTSVKSLIDENMLGVAETAGSMLDGDELASLTAEDDGGPKQQAVVKKLRLFAENFAFKYIYIVRPAGNGEYIFIADADENDPAAYGEKIVSSPALDSAGRGNAAVDKDAVPDEWGKYYTAYCPVKTSSGEIGGIVGVDFDAGRYESKMTKNAAYIIFASGFSLLIGGAMVLFVTMKLKSKLDRVNEETVSIATDIGTLLDEIRDETGYSQAADGEPPSVETQVSPAGTARKHNDGVERLTEEVTSIKANLKEYMKYTHAKAYTDGMTGVGNKTAYIELVHDIDRRIEAGNIHFSIAVFDVNGLKTVNDEYGHEAGDGAIIGAAKCLRYVFPKENIYRIGGDEFIAVLENRLEEDMALAFQKLEKRVLLTNELAKKDTELPVSFSKGAATFRPGEDKAFKEVFRRADRELYRDKDNFYKQQGNHKEQYDFKN